MSEDTTENIDSQNDAVQDPVIDPDVTPQVSAADVEMEGDNVDELKEKLQKQQEQNQRLFERAKKAEGFEKQPDGSWVKVQKKSKAETIEVNSTQTEAKSDLLDTIAFINAKVTNPEDVEAVKDYAKFKNIGLPQALESPVVKGMLQDNLDKRNTANATNTGKSRSTTNSQSVEALFAKARKTGEIPDNDADLDKMMEARYTPKSKN